MCQSSSIQLSGLNEIDAPDMLGGGIGWCDLRLEGEVEICDHEGV